MRKKKGKCPDCPRCIPPWFANYSDLITNMLVFFLLILSMSSVESKKVMEYISSIQDAIGFETESVSQLPESSTDSTQSNTDESTNASKAELSKLLDTISKMNKDQVSNDDLTNDGAKESSSLEIGKNGFKISIPYKFLFEKGAYTINSETISPIIKNVVELIKDSGEETTIEIIGFSEPDETELLNKFINPKNLWELAFFRAESVAQELFAVGIHQDKVKMSTRGEFSTHDFSDSSNNRVVEIFVNSDKAESDLSKNKKDFFDKIAQAAKK